MPTIISTPIADWMFSDVPVSQSVKTTPTRPNGAATIMMSGSSHEANCAAITR